MIKKEYVLLVIGVLLIIYTILTPKYVVCIKPGPGCNTNWYNPLTSILGAILIIVSLILFSRNRKKIKKK